MHLVGHSFGGQVALDLALLAPHRVRDLTLICSRDTPDQVSTPAAMSALASRLQQANLTVLPGAAHMSPFTDPAALADLIVHGRLE